MRIRHSAAAQFWLESGALAVATPFLLFPERMPVATAAALLLLAAVWLYFWHRPLPPTPLNLALLVLTLTIVVGILVTADFDLTLPKATGLLLGLAVWRHAVHLLHTPFQLRLSLIAYGLMTAGMVLFGVLSVNWMDKVPALQGWLQWLPSRLFNLQGVAGGGVHSNQLAGTLLFVLPPLFGLMVWARQQRPRPLGILVAAVLLIFLLGAVLILTQSRAGWLGALAGVAAFYWLMSLLASPRSSWRPLRWLLPVIGVLSVVLVVVLIGPARLQQYWLAPPEETAIGSLGTLSFRQEVWRWGLVAVGDVPFTGYGLGAFRAAVQRLYPIALPPNYDIAHAHNIFLQTALDLGIPGLIAYLALVGLAGWMGWQTAREDPRLRPLIVGLLAALIAFHTYGLIDALALGSKPALLFWINLALLSRISSAERVAPSSHEPYYLT